MALRPKLWCMYVMKRPLGWNFDEYMQCNGSRAPNLTNVCIKTTAEHQLWRMYATKPPSRLNFDECTQRNGPATLQIAECITLSGWPISRVDECIARGAPLQHKLNEREELQRNFCNSFKNCWVAALSCRPQSVKHSAILAPRATKMQVLKSCRPQCVIHSLILQVGSQKVWYIQQSQELQVSKCDTFGNSGGRKLKSVIHSAIARVTNHKMG